MRKQLEQNSKGNKEGWSKIIERRQIANRRRDSIEEKVYISKNGELRVEIIQLHHDILVVKYEGK